MAGEALNVVVCGTCFGEHYLAAIARLGGDVRLAGILARGGARSRARSHGVMAAIAKPATVKRTAHEVIGGWVSRQTRMAHQVLLQTTHSSATSGTVAKLRRGFSGAVAWDVIDAASSAGSTRRSMPRSPHTQPALC